MKTFAFFKAASTVTKKRKKPLSWLPHAIGYLAWISFQAMWPEAVLAGGTSGVHAPEEAGFNSVPALTYVVQPDDQMGFVLGGLGICPLWGTHSQVVRAVKLNPGLHYTRGNLLFPGQEIRLPAQRLAASADYEVSSSGLVRFLVKKPPMLCASGAPDLPVAQNKTEKAAADRLPASESEPVGEDSSPRDQTSPSTPIAIPQVSRRESEFTPASMISITPEYRSTGIEAVDRINGTPGHLVSSVNAGLSLSLSQAWTKEVETEFYFKAQRQEIVPPASALQTLASPDNTLYSLGGKASCALGAGESTVISGGLGVQQETFLTGLALNSATLQVEAPAHFDLELSERLAEITRLSLWAKLAGSVYAPVNTGAYATHTNFAYQATLEVRDTALNSLGYRLGLFYESLGQSTSEVTQSQTDYGLYLRFDLPLGLGGNP